MRFLSIPQSGLSWQQPLVYSFTTEGDEPEDVRIVIYDLQSGGPIATKMLYGVTVAQVDIAPYLRSVYQESIVAPEATGVMVSTTSRYVGVDVGGVVSSPALFLAAPLNVEQPEMLSMLADVQDVEYGDLIYFTLFTPQRTKLVITSHTPLTARRQQFTGPEVAQPLDVIIHTARLAPNIKKIVVDIYNGEGQYRTLTFNIVASDSRSKRLFWRNARGGVESYSFPRSIRLATQATIDKFATGKESYYARLKSSTECYRLCSAYESANELERIAEIIRSPYVYEMMGGQLRPVELRTRSVEYGAHGELRQLLLEVETEWDGASQTDGKEVLHG